MEPRTLHTPGKLSTTKLHPQFTSEVFKAGSMYLVSFGTGSMSSLRARTLRVKGSKPWIQILTVLLLLVLLVFLYS
jgi:hypothetical protein